MVRRTLTNGLSLTPKAVPGHDPHEDRGGHDVDERKAENQGPIAPGNGDRGVFDLTGRDGRHFDSDEGIEREAGREPDAPEAVRKESALAEVVGETGRVVPDETEEHEKAESDEEDDRHDLDHREPVAELAESPDGPGVHIKKSGGKDDDPEGVRDVGKPEAHVGGDRHHVPADDHHLAQPVAHAHRVAGEGREIHFGVKAERSRRGMGDAHLGQRRSQEKRDAGDQERREDDARSRCRNRRAAREEEPGPDGPSDRDHDLLAAREDAGEDLLLLDRGMGGEIRAHWTSSRIRTNR